MKSVAVALLAGQAMRHFASSKNHPFAKVVVKVYNVVANACTNYVVAACVAKHKSVLDTGNIADCDLPQPTDQEFWGSSPLRGNAAFAALKAISKYAAAPTDIAAPSVVNGRTPTGDGTQLLPNQYRKKRSSCNLGG